MSKLRKAGDKLNQPTKESAEAKQALSQSERNKQIREEIGNDPERLAERIAVVDRDAYDFDGFTDKQINMALQGEKFGDEDYARLTGKPIDDGGKPSPDPKPDPTPDPDFGIPTPTPDPAPTPFPGPVVGLPGSISRRNSQTQHVIQNNDINSSVTGDNNVVTNNQDNSVRQYGGNTNAYEGDSQRFTNDYIKKFAQRFI